jgi:hypothetical protein
MRSTRRLDSKLSISTEAHPDNRIREVENDDQAEVESVDQPLYPESAIERAILNRFAHVLG